MEKAAWEDANLVSLRYFRIAYATGGPLKTELPATIRDAVDWSAWRDKWVLDVGAGPRSECLRVFEGANVVLIEPLAESYLEYNGKAYQDERIKAIHACPAEDFIPELVDTIDFAWCHSVLRYVFDRPAVLHNMAQYLKSGGLFLIGTPAGIIKQGFTSVETPAALRDMLHESGLTIDREHISSDITGKPSRQDITILGHK